MKTTDERDWRLRVRSMPTASELNPVLHLIKSLNRNIIVDNGKIYYSTLRNVRTLEVRNLSPYSSANLISQAKRNNPIPLDLKSRHGIKINVMAEEGWFE